MHFLFTLEKKKYIFVSFSTSKCSSAYHRATHKNFPRVRLFHIFECHKPIPNSSHLEACWVIVWQYSTYLTKENHWIMATIFLPADDSIALKSLCRIDVTPYPMNSLKRPLQRYYWSSKKDEHFNLPFYVLTSSTCIYSLFSIAMHYVQLQQYTDSP